MATLPTRIFNLTLHNNFTPVGLTRTAFPGGLVPDKSFNGVSGWAFGVTDLFEAGLYLPLQYPKDRVRRSMVANYAYCLPGRTPPNIRSFTP